MLSQGLCIGYTSAEFECCVGSDVQREEFCPFINMLCPTRSCSLGLGGAWEKLARHNISNTDVWGLLMLGLHMGHPAHKISNNFLRGSWLKSIAYIS